MVVSPLMKHLKGGLLISLTSRPSTVMPTSITQSHMVPKNLVTMHTVTISSPIVWIYSQVADLGSACKLAPQSPGLPQTERLSMRVLKSILKLREVSPLAWELYTVSRKGQVTKHK